MNTPKRPSQLQPKQADSFSYEATTTEKNDQIYLNNMDLTQSKHSTMNILDSGNYINSNVFNHSSIQSIRVSHSFTSDNNKDNDHNALQTHTDLNITIGQIQKDFSAEDNEEGHETPISTLCNYYLKSEMTSTKTKQQMKEREKRISPVKISEFNYIPFTTLTNAHSKGKNEGLDVISLKVAQKLALNSDNKERKKMLIFKKHIVNADKIGERCRSSSAKGQNEMTKKMMINAVKRIYHSMKKRIDHGRNSVNSGKKKKVAPKSILNEKRSSCKALISRNTSNNNAASIEKKMNNTAQAPFNQIKKQATPRIHQHHHIPINHLYKKQHKHSPLPTHHYTNTSTKSNQRQNTIVLEVTENDIIALETTHQTKESKLKDLFRRRNLSQKPFDRRSSSQRKHSTLKKAFCDSSNRSYVNTTINNTTENKIANDCSSRGKIVSRNIIDINLNCSHSKKKRNSDSSRLISLRKLKSDASTRGNSNSNKDDINQINYLFTDNKIRPFNAKADVHKSKSKSKGKKQDLLITPSRTITSTRIMTISSKKVINSYITNPIQSIKRNPYPLYTHNTSNRKESKENIAPNSKRRLNVTALTNNIKHITITPK